MDNKQFFQPYQDSRQVKEIQTMNDYSQNFGLSLAGKDIEVLLQERKGILKEQERVEFRGGILKKLIAAFCDSAYIWQDNYADTLGRLQEIFYQYKNEAMDDLTDDELISYMKEKFEGDCQGSLDYLEDTCLEEFARNIRENQDWREEYWNTNPKN